MSGVLRCARGVAVPVCWVGGAVNGGFLVPYHGQSGSSPAHLKSEKPYANWEVICLGSRARSYTGQHSDFQRSIFRSQGGHTRPRVIGVIIGSY